MTFNSLAQNVIRVRASGVPVLDLENNPKAATAKIVAEIKTALREDDVRCIVLGCAGMVHIAQEFDVGQNVTLIDGVRSATEMAAAVTR